MAYYTGQKITISGAALYAASTSTKAAAYKTGTYYIWEPSVIKGRIRITCYQSYCGKYPASVYVTGWINTSAIKSASGGGSSSGGSSTPAPEQPAPPKVLSIYTSSEAMPPTVADPDNARRTELFMTVSGANISSDIQARFISLTYTDVEDGGADDLEIVLDDRDNVVIGTWLKTEVENRATANKNKSAKITLNPTITQENWNGDGKTMSLACGNFELDDISMKGPPQQVTMKATALAFTTGTRNVKKSRAWENITLLNIAKKIAQEGGYNVMYLSVKTIKYTRKEQVDQTDIAFLQALCTTAGVSLKINNGAIILFDQKDYESKVAVRKITRGDGSYGTYSFRTKLADTFYSSCHVKYTDATTGKVYEATYTPSGYTYNKDTVLEVSNERVNSNDEAKTLAISKLREANKGEKTGNFTMPGDVTLVAGLTVEVAGFGGYDGKYIIEQGKHSIKKKGGYTLTINLREAITAY